MTLDHDLLVDSALEEVLGGIQPPDLSQRILLAVREASDDPETSRAIDPALVSLQPQANRAVTRGERRSPVLPVAWALSILVASVLIGLFALELSGEKSDPSGTEVAEENLDQGAERSVKDSETGDEIDDDAPSGTVLPNVPFKPKDPESRIVRQWSAPELAELRTEVEMVSAVNQRIATAWKNHQWEPETISDQQWLVRVFERVFGLDFEDLNTNGLRAKPSQRAELLDELFADPRYRRAFASKWSNVWLDHLMTTAPQRGAGVRRQQLAAFLTDAIRDGVPPRSWPKQLLSASGTVEESAGATAWLVAHADRGNQRITSAVGEVFLGSRLVCARCHDDRGDSELYAAKMSDYWQLNAFFGQLRQERDPRSKEIRLIDRDMTDEVIFYEIPGGYQKAAMPVFLDGQTIVSDGRVESAVRREELGEWIGTSPQWHAVVVHQVWKTVFGMALNVDSNAELRLKLVEQSAAQGDKLETLVRWLVLSDAFCRVGAEEVPHRGDGHWASNLPVGAYLAEVKYGPAVDLLNVASSNDGNSILSARNVADPSDSISVPVRTVVPLDADGVAFVDRIIRSELRWQERIDHVFLFAVGRPPTAGERKVVDEIHAKQPDEAKALETIMEALANSAASHTSPLD
ncbi:MAG: DUF1549 domain-containing protein [Pirellulaceae bacterium]